MIFKVIWFSYIVGHLVICVACYAFENCVLQIQEPPRNKTHWDYLLEEMRWLAADFAQERKWKRAAARKVH